MLWDAGQQRVAEEQRARLIEGYVTARDGYVAGNIAAGKVKPKTAYRGPRYMQTAAADAAPPQSVASYRATLARLGALMPGAVREH